MKSITIKKNYDDDDYHRYCYHKQHDYNYTGIQNLSKSMQIIQKFLLQKFTIFNNTSVTPPFRLFDEI